MLRSVLCAIVILLVMPTQVQARECTYITMGYNSFTQTITVRSNEPILAVQFGKTTNAKVDDLVVYETHATFKVSTPNSTNWRVDYEVVTTCRTWKTFMGTSNLDPNGR